MPKPKKIERGISQLVSAEYDVADFFSRNLEAKYVSSDRVPDYKDFFVEAFSILEPNTKYIHNWHIDFFCDLLQKETERIIRGDKKDKDYVINMMFRSLKSYIFTIIFNAWAWAKAPYLRFVTASYAHALSIEHANKTRQLIKSQWYKSNFGDIYEISQFQDSKEYFANTMGGERKAVSVGGQFTGSGGNFLIIDDPVKPPEKNIIGYKESDIVNSNSWYSGTAYSRLNNPKVDLRIILMQRVHNNDLSGYILSGENSNEYEHINIPGELNDDIKPKYLKKFYMPDLETGRYLFFRDRFPSRILKTYRSELGDNYHGQVNQKPTSERGAKWKSDMFHIIEDEMIPDSIGAIDICGWDLATTIKTEGSSSAYVKGRIKNRCLYIYDTDYKWLEYPELIKWIKAVGGIPYIENKSSGLQAVPHLISEGVPAQEYKNSNMDKFSHTKTATFYAKNMTIFIARSIWEKLLFDKVNGICEFPNSVKDDVNDAMNILVCTAYDFIGDFKGVNTASINDEIDLLIKNETYSEDKNFDFNALNSFDLWNESL